MRSYYTGLPKLILRVVRPVKKIISRLYRFRSEKYGVAVPHLFVHSLSMFPAKSFRTDNNPIPGFEKYYVTVDEFKAALERLYANGFVLVSIYDAVSGNYKLPEGKKPLVFSFDDINYYPFMRGYGFAKRMILTEDGRIAHEYVDEDGQTKITFEGDSMPIIETFIESHPDFSYNGARGVIAVTGYEGVLGYDRPEEQRDALEPLVAALKEKGWLFASHSWGHHHRAYTNGPIFTYKGKRDIDRWFREVSPFVGKTDIFITPFGIETRRNARFDAYLHRCGFKYFCTVSSCSTLTKTHGAYYYSRITFDGEGLSETPYNLYPLLGHFHPFISKDRKNCYPDAILTSEGLLETARKCLDIPTVYVWGAQGEQVTRRSLKEFKKSFPEKFDHRKIRELKPFCGKGYRGFDCSGIMRFYAMGGFDHFNYNPYADLNCAKMLASSSRSGTIDTLPEEPGLCLYMEGHTGVYEGDGSVIESTPNPRFGNGVVRTRLSDRPWTHWFEMPWVENGKRGG